VTQLLTTHNGTQAKSLCVCVFCIGIFAPLRVVSLIATCVFLASSGVCVCVCVCDCERARACLGLYAILVFPRFCVCCDLCSGCVTYCHLCLTGFKGLCVCARPGRLLCGC
jgi:hypothetical protein